MFRFPTSAILITILVLSIACTRVLAADDAPLTSEEQQLIDQARRDEAIADYTRKMREANYPALFDAAAAEFNVPSDVLKGVSFAETRWDHLTWPPGETASPETGMPRPYGIMSLWDNKYFGHSLIEAAKLLGKDPDELKLDPYQNIRGGAALLRKIYNETPRPDGSQESQIESWRYAIRVYSGIPEPDLNAQHALNVFISMNKGYHQYGIEWNAHPVNLEPIREETRRIVAEEKKKRKQAQPAVAAAASNSDEVLAAPISSPSVAAVESNAPPVSAPAAAAQPAEVSWAGLHRWIWWLLAPFLIVAGGFMLYRKRLKLVK